MRKWILGLVCFISAVSALAQNKYGLQAINFPEYKASLKNNPEKKLVDLENRVPGLLLDIRYATMNNFTGQKIYDLAKAYARKPVAEALRQAQVEFNSLGMGVKMYDAYRPYKATVKFYEEYHDTTYVASPFKGSRHNRGCALDMTVVDRKTGKELKMPTGYDSFTHEAWPTAPAKDPEAGKNRALLISVMEKYGFKVSASEWWHFDFVGWQKFEVMDIDFEELVKE